MNHAYVCIFLCACDKIKVHTYMKTAFGIMHHIVYLSMFHCACIQMCIDIEVVSERILYPRVRCTHVHTYIPMLMYMLHTVCTYTHTFTHVYATHLHTHIHILMYMLCTVCTYTYTYMHVCSKYCM